MTLPALGTALSSITLLPYSSGTCLLGVPIDPSATATRPGRSWGNSFTPTSYSASAWPPCHTPSAFMPCSAYASGQQKFSTPYAHATSHSHSLSPATYRKSNAGVSRPLSAVLPPLSDDQWLQASLPVRAGGCGLGDAAVLAPVARLAGVLQFLREGPQLLGVDSAVTLRLRRDRLFVEAPCRVLPSAM